MGELNSSDAKIYLIDDDPSVLRAIGRLVRSAGWESVPFNSGQEFLDQQVRFRAGCIILDIDMPGLNGLELQTALDEAGNALPIIFLTGDGDVPATVRAMKSGAVDFLTKPCNDDELIAAIRIALARNRKELSAQVAKRELEGRFATLTPREHEVMLGVVAGKMNKEIAADLGSAEKTIKVHRGRVMKKVGVQSLAELVRLAERSGISPEQR